MTAQPVLIQLGSNLYSTGGAGLSSTMIVIGAAILVVILIVVIRNNAGGLGRLLVLRQAFLPKGRAIRRPSRGGRTIPRVFREGPLPLQSRIRLPQPAEAGCLLQGRLPTHRQGRRLRDRRRRAQGSALRGARATDPRRARRAERSEARDSSVEELPSPSSRPARSPTPR